MHACCSDGIYTRANPGMYARAFFKSDTPLSLSLSLSFPSLDPGGRGYSRLLLLISSSANSRFGCGVRTSAHTRALPKNQIVGGSSNTHAKQEVEWENDISQRFSSVFHDGKGVETDGSQDTTELLFITRAATNSWHPCPSWGPCLPFLRTMSALYSDECKSTTRLRHKGLFWLP